MDEQPLQGGLANAGSVVRVGSHVLRPSGPQTPSVHAYLNAITSTGFDGAPRPVGIEPDGRQRLQYIEGDVPTSPYPDWCQTGDALASIARLLRRLHDASANFDPNAHTWNQALADPRGGTVMGHNDVELSNIVFRNGEAAALIDFEFAAPGRPVYDLAHLARLCVPIGRGIDRDRMRWKPADHPTRLRLAADSYGLNDDGRAQLLGAIDDALNRVEAAAKAGFGSDNARAAKILAATGGMEKYDRRRSWWRSNQARFAAALR